jgi:iron-sulfur cluster repair protein YtfE (RIC family)
LAVHAIPAPSEPLKHLLGLDHRRLDAILAATKRSLRAGDIARGLAQFREFRDGLERHIAAEEDVLFPSFESLVGGAGGGPTHVMRQEHDEIRRRMGEIVSALERGGHEELTTPLAGLTARIYAHNGKEERILYPAMDRAARDAGALEGLLRRLGALGINPASAASAP